MTDNLVGQQKIWGTAYLVVLEESCGLGPSSGDSGDPKPLPNVCMIHLCHCLLEYNHGSSDAQCKIYKYIKKKNRQDWVAGGGWWMPSCVMNSQHGKCDQVGLVM